MGEGEGDSERLPSCPRRMAVARMAGLLTYHSKDSFESRFGRHSGRVFIKCNPHYRVPRHLSQPLLTTIDWY